jgi:arylsulfatase A-like enzyme
MNRRPSAWAVLALLLLVLGCRGRGDDGPPPAKTRVASVEDDAPIAPVASVHTVEAWMDLLAQRPSAVVVRHGAVLVDLGLENARKHVATARQNQWILGESAHDRTGGVVVGRTASLDIPLDGDLSPAAHLDGEDHAGLAMSMTLHTLVPKQSVTVLWNERVLAHLTLSEGWERRTLSLPEDLVRPGDNRLRLHFRRTGPWGDHASVAAIVQEVTVGTHARITEPPPDDERPAYRAEPRPDAATRLHLQGDTAIAFYFVPPPRGRLRIDATGHGALDVRVSTTADHVAGRAPTVLLDEPLRPSQRKADLDLAGWGSTPVRMEVRVRGSTADSVATISQLEVVVPRTIPVDRRPRTPRDLVVVSVEGLRADALQRGKAPSLPNIEALMERAVVFDRAYALSPAAVPSHAAWLSSVSPPVHLTVRGTFVADGQKLMPEILSRAGYFRVLMTSNDYVSHERGLWQGFDSAKILGELSEERHADAVIAAGIDALQGRRRRWFLLANVNDPQAPYDPPRELLREVEPPAGAPAPHHTHIWVGRVRLGRSVPDAAQLAYVRRLYRGEVQVVDRAIGSLRERLEEVGRFEDAIIVLLGVHGEEFLEHGGAGHDRKLFEESLRVPLVIHAPAVLDPGRVVAPVDLLDLAPTLADLVGAAAPDIWQGESLLPLTEDPQPPPRLVVAYLGDGSRAAVIGEHKLVVGAGGSEVFFDLSVDPGEQEDRLLQGGVGLRMVRTALAWQLAHETRWRRVRWGTGANLRPAFALDLGM